MVISSKLENPLGFFESERLVETNDACLKSLAAGGIGLRFFLHVGICLHFSKRSSPTEAGYLFMPLSGPGSIKIRACALRIPHKAYSSSSYTPCSCSARTVSSGNASCPQWLQSEPWSCAVDLYHHIASQLFRGPVASLHRFIGFDDQSLKQRLGFFLEIHGHSRPSEDQARALISGMIRPELNRSETAINDQSRARIHPLLLEVCKHAYKNITQSSDQLICYKEQFNSLPRAVLECSVREQIFPECDFGLICNSLHSIENKTQKFALLLEQSERECESYKRQIDDLRSSRSWQITALFALFWISSGSRINDPTFAGIYAGLS